MDDFLDYGDSRFFVSDDCVEITEKKGHSIFLLIFIAIPPLVIILCLVIFAPEVGAEKPAGYVVLGFWFLAGMFAYLYRKKIILDFIKKEFSYKTSVLGFPLTDISRKISEIEEVDSYAFNKSDTNQENGVFDYVLFFKVGRKKYEINRMENKEACEQQKYFFKDLIEL